MVQLRDEEAYACGVALALCVSCLNSAGMGFQKRVHVEQAHLATKAAVWAAPQWIAGLCCMAFASVLSLVNYYLIGPSRASAMASLTIVTNAVRATPSRRAPHRHGARASRSPRRCASPGCTVTPPASPCTTRH